MVLMLKTKKKTLKNLLFKKKGLKFFKYAFSALKFVYTI